MSQQLDFNLPIQEELPELAFNHPDGHIRIERRAFYKLSRRISALQLLLVEYIMDLTTSALPDAEGQRPEWANAEVKDFRMLTAKSDRTIGTALAGLEKMRIIIRRFPHEEGQTKPSHRGGFKINHRILPDVYQQNPRQPRPAKHRPRSKPISAHLAAPSEVAELALTVAAQYGEPLQFTAEVESPQPTVELPIPPAAAEPTIPPVIAEREAPPATAVALAAHAAEDPALPNIAQELRIMRDQLPEVPQPVSAIPETYCPWGWNCPLIEKGLQADAAPQTETETSKTVGRLVEIFEQTNQPTSQSPKTKQIVCAIPQDLLDRLGYPDATLLQKIAEAIPTAPLERLTEKIERRRAAFIGPRGSIGLVLELAKEVEANHVRGVSERRTATPAGGCQHCHVVCGDTDGYCNHCKKAYR
jgi:hypothetical protein